MYAWLFPVTAINKYSHWIDVHTVRPTSPSTCTVTFDYFMTAEAMQRTTAPEMMAALTASADIQREVFLRSSSSNKNKTFRSVTQILLPRDTTRLLKVLNSLFLKRGCDFN